MKALNIIATIYPKITYEPRNEIIKPKTYDHIIDNKTFFNELDQFKINISDIENLDLDKIPLLYNHSGEPIGFLYEWYLDSDKIKGKIKITDKNYIKKVINKEINYISPCIVYKYNDEKIISVFISEISLTKDPYFKENIIEEISVENSLLKKIKKKLYNNKNIFNIIQMSLLNNNEDNSPKLDKNILNNNNGETENLQIKNQKNSEIEKLKIELEKKDKELLDQRRSINELKESFLAAVSQRKKEEKREEEKDLILLETQYNNQIGIIKKELEGYKNSEIEKKNKKFEKDKKNILKEVSDPKILDFFKDFYQKSNFNDLNHLRQGLKILSTNNNNSHNNVKKDTYDKKEKLKRKRSNDNIIDKKKKIKSYNDHINNKRMNFLNDKEIIKNKDEDEDEDEDSEAKEFEKKLSEVLKEIKYKV